MGTRTQATRRTRRWGLWLLLLTVLWAGATVWLFSDGAMSAYLDMLVLYLGGALMGTAALVTLVAENVSRAGETRSRRRWVPLAVTGLVMATVPSLCRYRLPFAGRFAASEQALAAAVAQAEPTTTPRWIGWFRVLQVDEAGGATRFTTGACGVAARCGVAHKRQGRPTPTRGASYRALRGPWWEFEQR